jgi:hypothetical protein
MEIAVNEFRRMLETDCMFSKQIAYRRVAMELSAKFHFGEPHPTHEVRSKPVTAQPVAGVAGEGAAGIEQFPLSAPPEDSTVMALERDTVLDNPNLARVHNDLPVRMQTKGEQKPMVMQTIPGEPPTFQNDFPSIENRELRYDKRDFGDPPAAVNRDNSEKVAAALGLKARGAQPAAKERGAKVVYVEKEK